MYEEQHHLSLIPEEKPPEASKRFFVAIDDEQRGPYTLLQLQSLWKAGALNLKSPYRFEEDTEWRHLEDALALLEPKEFKGNSYTPTDGKIDQIDKNLSKIWKLMLFFFILWLIDVALWIISAFFHSASVITGS
jgi:hypothetical protein